MADPYIGEIRLFGGNFAPLNWAFCNGQTLRIAEFDTLFNLIGTTYGGDGQQTFNLPDLRSRVPVHQGGGYITGQLQGVETVSLTAAQTGTHSHRLQGTTAGSNASPKNNLLAPAAGNVQNPTLYGTGTGSPVLTALAPSSITVNTGGQPHANIQPYLCISFIISLYGIYPPPA
jgi:microcystin-dependent protein